MTPAPHVIAVADQVLAAARSGASTDEISHVLVRWIGQRWARSSSYETLEQLDRDLFDLAVHLAGQRNVSVEWALRGSDGRPLSPQEALATRPELAAVVLPMLVLDGAATERTAAEHAWEAHLALAPTAARGDVMRARAGHLVGALALMAAQVGTSNAAI